MSKAGFSRGIYKAAFRGRIYKAVFYQRICNAHLCRRICRAVVYRRIRIAAVSWRIYKAVFCRRIPLPYRRDPYIRRSHLRIFTARDDRPLYTDSVAFPNVARSLCRQKSVPAVSGRVPDRV